MGQGCSMIGPVAPWDAAFCSHEHCIDVLRNSLHASYLVRRLKECESVLLYVQDQGEVLQYDIIFTEKRTWACCDVTLPSLNKILHHYTVNPLVAKSGSILLGEPVGKIAFLRLDFFLDGLEMPSWYVGVMEKTVCKQQVGNLPVGRFVVRCMSEPHSYQLFVSNGQKTLQYMIQEEDNISYKFGSDEFTSINEIVKSLRENGVKIGENDRLRFRCEDDPPEMDISVEFAGTVDRHTAKSYLKQSKMVSGSYLFSQNPDDFAQFCLTVINQSGNPDQFSFHFQKGYFVICGNHLSSWDQVIEWCNQAQLIGTDKKQIFLSIPVAGTFCAYKKILDQNKKTKQLPFGPSLPKDSVVESKDKAKKQKRPNIISRLFSSNAKQKLSGTIDKTSIERNDKVKFKANNAHPSKFLSADSQKALSKPTHKQRGDGSSSQCSQSREACTSSVSLLTTAGVNMNKVTGGEQNLKPEIHSNERHRENHRIKNTCERNNEQAIHISLGDQRYQPLPKPPQQIAGKETAQQRRRYRQDPAETIKELGLSMCITPLDVSGFRSLPRHAIQPELLPQYAVGPRLNRFRDILPNPATRVHLPVLPEDPTLEYINANYVRGFGGLSARSYIAAQAPLSTGIYNFWRMIWYTKVKSIIMATGFEEGGRKKCAHYFEEIPSEYSDKFTFGPPTFPIKVRTLAKIEHTCYSKRTLRYQAGDQEQDVTHFWFTAWPDHDVPVNPDGTIGTNETVNFLDAVRTHRSICQDKSPLLVHCSAGIGRTGTLLVIDHAMDAINNGEFVDINKIIAEVREDRMSLVQHVNQYKFCYQATVEYAKRKSQEAVDVKKRSMYEKTAPIYALATSKKEADAYSSSNTWTLHSQRGNTLIYSLNSARVPAELTNTTNCKLHDPERKSSSAVDRNNEGRMLNGHLHDDDDDESELEDYEVYDSTSSVEEDDALGEDIDPTDLSTRWWFRSNYTRTQVEDLLSEAPKGSFLVRYSSKPGHYAMSLQTGVGIVNMLISPQTSPDGDVRYKIGQSSSTLFRNLDDLVEECLRGGIMTGKSGTQVVKLVSNSQPITEA